MMPVRREIYSSIFHFKLRSDWPVEQLAREDAAESIKDLTQDKDLIEENESFSKRTICSLVLSYLLAFWITVDVTGETDW